MEPQADEPRSSWLLFVAQLQLDSRDGLRWPIGAPAALTGFIQSQLQQHPWWRMPAGPASHLFCGLGARTGRKTARFNQNQQSLVKWPQSAVYTASSY